MKHMILAKNKDRI